MKKLLLIGLLTIMSCKTAYADPAPFGLEIGNTTIEDLKAKYKVTSKGINNQTNGESFIISRGQIKFDGLKVAVTVFDKDGKLKAVVTKVDKDRFDNVLEILSQKYKLTSKTIESDDEKSYSFKEGDTIIEISKKRGQSEMNMVYMEKALFDKYEKAYNQHKQNEKNQL